MACNEVASLSTLHTRCCTAHTVYPFLSQAAMQKLDGKDWTQAIQGLNIVRQAAVHHKQTLDPLL